MYFDPGSDARLANPSRRPRRPSSDRAQAPSRNGRHTRAQQARRQAPSWYDGPDERAVRAEQARRAQVRDDARAAEEEVGQGKAKLSLSQKIRKQAAKRKADKAFAGFQDAGAGEGGPRAALYKGEMGSSQRRASRMQDEGSADAEGKHARRSFHFAFGPKLRVAAAVLGCLALVCVFLYQPAQQYYTAMREHAALEAEYAALQQRDEALQDRVDALSTDAGMEDEARDQFGWVKSGEIQVNVAGVEDASDSNSDIPANVTSDSVEPPDTWYSGILDPLFGVE